MGEEVKKRRLTRRKSGAGERGSGPPCGDAEARGWGERGRSRGLQIETRRLLQEYHAVVMGIIIKQCLRTEQDTRSLCGALFDTIIMATEHDVVARRSRERTAAAGCSTQVRQSSSDAAVARTTTVAGHPSRQVGRDEMVLRGVDEMVLRGVSAWLGERGSLLGVGGG